MSPGGHVNLGLVAQLGYSTVEDFETVAAAAREHDPRVHTAVFKDRPQRLRRRWLARRPSLFFGARPFSRFSPVRGRTFGGVEITKREEYRRLTGAGFRMPRTVFLTEHERPDLSDFGPYVVVKPDLGARGAAVKIVRKNRVRWKPSEFKNDIYEESPVRLVQEFIYTGPWPVSYRVQTLFGEALACFRLEASRDRTPLRERYAIKESGGVSIVASSKGCSIRLCDDQELIDTAERAHALFPECGNLGVDLIREFPSGDIYILEMNSLGGCWLLSLPRLDAECGARAADQRDGLRRAGRLLADAALRLAE